jgi:hypothetical protein
MAALDERASNCDSKQCGMTHEVDDYIQYMTITDKWRLPNMSRASEGSWVE